jgi:anti-sigma regulatory factor (Ser/Thr protein kinase)
MLLLDAGIDAMPSNIAPLRRVVTDTLQDWDVSSVIDDIVLIVSELVTNAVRYDGPRVDLHVQLRDGVLRVVVHDGASAPDPKRGRDDDDEGGRGLQIVEALARRWGIQPVPNGKNVWAELDVPSR